MNIPLIANTIISADKEQYIEIWRNSKREVVPSPFYPYFYSTYKMKIPYLKEEKVKRILFSNLKEKELYKYSFKNVRAVPQYREEDSIEADIVFTDRILIDEPDFFSKFPNTDKLKILHFDIEVDSEGLFPTPERNAIIGIGCKCGKRKAVYLAEDYNDDEEIIHKFFKFLKETDPDIVSHYNGARFDVPYLIKRMEKHHIPLDLWSRDRKKPNFYRNKLNFGGRVSFDIFNEVERDQTIYGIKNHKMKTVAKWLGYKDAVEIPLSNMRKLVNTDELKEYLKSDVMVTEFLFNTYFKNVLMMAEMLKVPLNLMVDASPSFIPRIIHGRKFQELGMVADKNNKDRHPEYINNKQGAIVDTFKPGLYRDKIFKIDYSSQYPRTVQTFNISPETVRILRYEKYTGKYEFNIDEWIFSIPDNRANKNIIIKIDMSKRGFLAKFVDEVLTERFEIKARMKEMDKNSVEYKVLHVRQNALKVLANIQTGYQGQEHARFGELACYNLITGMARYYVTLAMDWCKRNGSSPISVDTDGIYLPKEISVEELNRYLDDYTYKTFGLKNYLHVDIDEYDGAFFRKTKGKHYVLKDGDRILFHGQSFKGSHLPEFWDELLEQVARDMFEGKASRKNIDIKKYNIDKLKQTIRVRDITSYKSDSSLSMQLIKQAEQTYGFRMSEGDQLSYVKTKKGYELVVPGKSYDIDWDYYQEIVEKIFERLEIEDKRQWRF